MTSVRPRTLKPTSRPNQYFDLGVRGRKTGWTQKRAIKKDEDGLDNVDDFFYSDTEENQSDGDEHDPYEDNGFVENGGHFFPGDQDYENGQEAIQEEDEDEEEPVREAGRRLTNTSPFVSRPKVARTPPAQSDQQRPASGRKSSIAPMRERLQYEDEEELDEEEDRMRQPVRENDSNDEEEEEYELRRGQPSTPSRRQNFPSESLYEERENRGRSSVPPPSVSRRSSLAPSGLRSSTPRQTQQRRDSIRPISQIQQQSLRYEDAYGDYDPSLPLDDEPEYQTDYRRSPVRPSQSRRESFARPSPGPQSRYQNVEDEYLYEQERRPISTSKSQLRDREPTNSYRSPVSRSYVETPRSATARYTPVSVQKRAVKSSVRTPRETGQEYFEEPEPLYRNHVREKSVPRSQPRSQSISYSRSQTPRNPPTSNLSRSTPRSASASRSHYAPTPGSLKRTRMNTSLTYDRDDTNDDYGYPEIKPDHEYDDYDEPDYGQDHKQVARQSFGRRDSYQPAQPYEPEYEDEEADPVRRRRSYEVRKEEIDTPHGVQQTVVERTEESHYGHGYEVEPRVFVEKTVKTKRTVSRGKRAKGQGNTGRSQMRVEGIQPRSYHDEEYDADGVRRSRRNRIAPVKYWENERVMYGRRESAGGPMPLAIVSVARPERESDEYSRRRAKKARRPAISQNIPDVPCYDFETNELSERPIIISPNMLNLQDNKYGYKWQKTLGEKSFLASGILSFPKGTRKPSKASHDSALIFFVFAGTVKITINETSVTIGMGTHFMVPRGNHYAIENVGNNDARLFFCHGKEILLE